MVLLAVSHEQKVSHLSDQLCLLASDRSCQNRLLLEGFDEWRPLQEQDHVTYDKVALSVKGSPVEDSHDCRLIELKRLAQLLGVLLEQMNLELARLLGLIQLVEILELIEDNFLDGGFEVDVTCAGSVCSHLFFNF